MILFHSKNLWKRIEKCSKEASVRRAAVAYVTRDLPLRFQLNDTLVTNASEAAIGSGQTSAKILAQLHRRGVHLYSYGYLHSKVLVLEGRVFASSANLSDSSQRTLLEAGLETDNPTAVSQAIGFIDSLTEQSVLIDAEFIARISKIPVKRNWRPAPKGTRPNKIKLSEEPRTWLVGLHSVLDSKDPAELRRIEHGEKAAESALSKAKSQTSWARLARNSRVSKFAKRGDSVIIIWRSTNKGAPELAYHHSPVLVNQLEPKCHRIFYEAFSNAEKKALRWQEFKKLGKMVGLPKISKNTIRELTSEQSSALHELWEEVRRK